MLGSLVDISMIINQLMLIDVFINKVVTLLKPRDNKLIMSLYVIISCTLDEITGCFKPLYHSRDFSMLVPGDLTDKCSKG